MREITEHELNLITGNAEPSDSELAGYGYDADSWSRRVRKTYTQAMAADASERAERVMEWSACDEQRKQARVEAHRACTRAIWAAIARGEIRDPFLEIRRFRGPLGRG